MGLLYKLQRDYVGINMSNGKGQDTLQMKGNDYEWNINIHGIIDQIHVLVYC